MFYCPLFIVPYASNVTSNIIAEPERLGMQAFEAVDSLTRHRNCDVFCIYSLGALWSKTERG